MDCPACGGSLVTLEIDPEQPISASLSDVILGAEEDERIDITRTCWACNWREVRHIHVKSIETTTGDEAAVERAGLIDEITDELAAIENLDALESALAEVRRQRRLELSTADTDADSSE